MSIDRCIWLVVPLVALALLASAGPAAARSRVVPVPDNGSYLDGVALSGDRVVFALIAPSQAVEVIVSDPDGGLRSIASAPSDGATLGSASVATSGDLVWATRFTMRCSSECRNEEPGSQDSWIGPVTGPLARTIGCAADDRGCTPTTCDAFPQPFPVAIGADRVAERCLFGPSNGFTVTRLGVGPAQQFPEDTSPSLAGRYLASIAVKSGDGGPAVPSLVLRDLETGTEVARAPIPVNKGETLINEFDAVHVQDDGTTLVTLRPDAPTTGPRRWWVSPDEPTLHPLAVPGWPWELKGGLVAFTPTNPRSPNDDQAALMDLSGRVLVSVPSFRSAFDGRRLATTTRPCARAFVVVRDLADPSPVPGPPVGGCPAPRISRATVRATPAGRAYVDVGCPAAPALGCAGSLVLTRPGSSSPVARTKAFRIEPGARAAVGVRLRSAFATELRKKRRLDVVATTTTTPRAGDTRVKVRRARFVLVSP